jgi:hypothetical protein
MGFSSGPWRGLLLACERLDDRAAHLLPLAYGPGPRPRRAHVAMDRQPPQGGARRPRDARRRQRAARSGPRTPRDLRRSAHRVAPHELTSSENTYKVMNTRIESFDRILSRDSPGASGPVRRDCARPRRSVDDLAPSSVGHAVGGGARPSADEGARSPDGQPPRDPRPRHAAHANHLRMARSNRSAYRRGGTHEWTLGVWGCCSVLNQFSEALAHVQSVRMSIMPMK